MKHRIEKLKPTNKRRNRPGWSSYKPYNSLQKSLDQVNFEESGNFRYDLVYESEDNKPMQTQLVHEEITTPPFASSIVEKFPDFFIPPPESSGKSSPFDEEKTARYWANYYFQNEEVKSEEKVPEVVAEPVKDPAKATYQLTHALDKF